MIDLNADLGEIPGDIALMPLLTSANIACGGHAGDANSMSAALAEAVLHGVAIGAHPSYPDRDGFGRRELRLPPEAVGASVVEQVTRLQSFASEKGARVSYLKLHGALYHRAGKDAECAAAIVSSLAEAGLGGLAVLAQPGAVLLDLAAAEGWATAREAFCDRAYLPNGHLKDRAERGAVLDLEGEVVAQAVCIATQGRVRASDGSWVRVEADSLCLHGDTPGALGSARAVRRALEAAGVEVSAFAA